MKIKRVILERIVYQEYMRRVGMDLNEAPLPIPDEDEDELPLNPDSTPDEPAEMPELGSEEQSLDDEPTDDELVDDPREDGSVSKELEGKRVQSITMDSKSKMMPGAAEVVITFEDTPDALRILLTKTGDYKFFYKGLHSDLETASSSDPDDGEEPSLGPDDIDDVPGESSIVTPDTQKKVRRDDFGSEEQEEDDI